MKIEFLNLEKKKKGINSNDNNNSRHTLLINRRISKIYFDNQKEK